MSDTEAGEEYDSPEVAVRVVGTVQTTTPAPSCIRVGACARTVVAAAGDPELVLGADPQRRRALIMATGGTAGDRIRVSSRLGPVASGILWPQDQPLELGHSDEVWVSHADSGDDITVSYLAESAAPLT